ALTAAPQVTKEYSQSPETGGWVNWTSISANCPANSLKVTAGRFTLPDSVVPDGDLKEVAADQSFTILVP
ncbi:MAG: hypothetical protein MUE51_04530, partial [Thermoleophilia bacterium]|nr:hypothetical protein [Thermoleophilia bacterium]